MVLCEYDIFTLSDTDFIRDRLIEIMDHCDRCMSQKYCISILILPFVSVTNSKLPTKSDYT